MKNIYEKQNGILCQYFASNAQIYLTVWVTCILYVKERQKHGQSEILNSSIQWVVMRQKAKDYNHCYFYL